MNPLFCKYLFILTGQTLRERHHLDWSCWHLWWNTDVPQCWCDEFYTLPEQVYRKKKICLSLVHPSRVLPWQRWCNFTHIWVRSADNVDLSQSNSDQMNPWFSWKENLPVGRNVYFGNFEVEVSHASNRNSVTSCGEVKQLLLQLQRKQKNHIPETAVREQTCTNTHTHFSQQWRNTLTSFDQAAQVWIPVYPLLVAKP